MDTYDIYNFATAHPEFVPMLTSLDEGGTNGTDLAVEEVINL